MILTDLFLFTSIINDKYVRIAIIPINLVRLFARYKQQGFTRTVITLQNHSNSKNNKNDLLSNIFYIVLSKHFMYIYFVRLDNSVLKSD